MNTGLFYDSETTGLPLWSEPSDDPRQPHPVQLGARLVDLDSRRILGTLDLIIRPEGWVIDEEVAKIHGIDQGLAMAVGVPEKVAVSALMELWAAARVRIGHNESFDARILRIALKRLDDEDVDAWKDGRAECTAALATPIMDMAPTEKMQRAGFTHAKKTNLREAFKFFTGRELDGAHNALVDVDACMAVYFAIKDRQQQAA